MRDLAIMNGAAELVVNRDNAPFSRHPDTIVFDSDKDPTTDPLGEFSLGRTSREGVASLDEFVDCFYGDSGYDPRLPTEQHPVGTPVTSFIALGRVFVKGEVAGAPFFTIRRTPVTCVPGQTTGRHLKREGNVRNPDAQRFNSYVGGLWLAIDYPDGGTTTRTHASLFSIARDSQQAESRINASRTPLVFGEEDVAQALSGRFGRIIRSSDSTRTPALVSS